MTEISTLTFISCQYKLTNIDEKEFWFMQFMFSGSHSTCFLLQKRRKEDVKDDKTLGIKKQFMK